VKEAGVEEGDPKGVEEQEVEAEFGIGHKNDQEQNGYQYAEKQKTCGDIYGLQYAKHARQASHEEIPHPVVQFFFEEDPGCESRHLFTCFIT
jgi:hypothetical protein